MHDVLLSPGDVTGDGIPDIYARERATGNLWLYTMTRSGTASSQRIVGSGWNTLDMLIAPGDVTGDGVPDLFGRRAVDGALMFYTVAAGGTPTSVRAVDAGWHVFDAIVGIGDVTGDGRGDLMARTGDGVIRTYGTRSDGTITAAMSPNTGWGSFDTLIGGRDASGSFLLARDPLSGNGALRRYPVGGSGSISAALQAGTGWNMHAAMF